jgi:hypothetical protein
MLVINKMNKTPNQNYKNPDTITIITQTWPSSTPKI